MDAPATTLPFAHLNLTRNPFGEPVSRARGWLAVVDVGHWAEALEARCDGRSSGAWERRRHMRPQRFARSRRSSGASSRPDSDAPSPGPLAIQFRGPPGRGKSTHLLALHERFPAAPFLRYSEEGFPEVPVTGSGPIFLDDLHMLPAARRERLWRSRRSTALATHHDLGRELESCDYDVIDVVVEDEMDERRLRRILERRVEWARRGPGPVPGVSAATIRQLRSRYGTDIRSMEGELYDRLQKLRSVRNV